MGCGLPNFSSTSSTTVPRSLCLGLTGCLLLLQVNTFMSFVFPMLVISILNTVIANKLTAMVRQAAEQGRGGTVGTQDSLQHSTFSMSIEPGRVQALRHGVLVLRT